MDNAGPDGAILILLVVVIYRGEKSCTVLLDKGLFLKKKNDICNQTFRLALEHVENRQSWVSFVAIVSLDGQISVQSWPPIKDHSYKATYFFCPCARMRCLSNCASSFCSPCQVRFSTASYRVWSADHALFRPNENLSQNFLNKDDNYETGCKKMTLLS